MAECKSDLLSKLKNWCESSVQMIGLQEVKAEEVTIWLKMLKNPFSQFLENSSTQVYMLSLWISMWKSINWRVRSKIFYFTSYFCTIFIFYKRLTSKLLKTSKARLLKELKNMCKTQKYERNRILIGLNFTPKTWISSRNFWVLTWIFVSLAYLRMCESGFKSSIWRKRRFVDSLN